jgi:hypothetical protein
MCQEGIHLPSELYVRRLHKHACSQPYSPLKGSSNLVNDVYARVVYMWLYLIDISCLWLQIAVSYRL